MKIIIEACVESLEEALHAEKCGADQIELCAKLEHGGLTPDIKVVRTILKQIRIPVKAMIRPRTGNFVYTDEEILLMKDSIHRMKNEGVDGLVLGILHENGEVNVEQSTMLIREAGQLPVTFHRAVDETPDPIKAVREISRTGASFILSSGKGITALQGAETIRQMIKTAGPDLTIIAAAGITVHNLGFVKQTTGARAFHGTGIVGRIDNGIPWHTI